MSKRNMFRKSQLYSQVFIYILSIFLISFILIYGYNAIHNFITGAERIECLKFKNDLSNAIENILGDYGSVQIKEFSLCGDYSKVCFVESFEGIETSNLPLELDIDPIIEDSISSGTEKNVFLIENIAKESYYIGKISVEPDIFCINATNNRISLRLEGKGKYVLLSQYK